METNDIKQALLSGQATSTYANERNWGAIVSSLITAIGNYNVQYNFQAISIALIVMSKVECTQTNPLDCQQGHQESWVSGTAGATVFAGAIFGQLTMGYAGDIIGRNLAMTVTLSIAAVSALFSAVLPTGSASAVYITIIICRFLLGVGLGGIYPLSAIKAAEDAAAASSLEALKKQSKLQQQGGKAANVGSDESDSDKDVHASSAAKAFFWQAPGAMSPWILALILTYYPSVSTNTRWRLLLGLGTVPATLAIILSFIEVRLNKQQVEWLEDHLDNLESSQIQEDAHLAALAHAMQAGHDGAASPALTQPVAHRRSRTRTSSSNSFISVGTSGTAGTTGTGVGTVLSGQSLSYYSVRSSMSFHSTRSILATEKGALKAALVKSDNRRKLIATGGGWFLYDVCYYGVALFGGQILASLEHPDDDNVTSDINIRTTTQKEILALSMAIPGCLASIYLLSRISTKRLQIYGFLLIVVCFVLLAVLTEPLKDNPNALYALYCTLLFALTIPNVTTYILPAETFPKDIRSTFNGISAACGKAGAVVGAYVFGPLAAATSYNFVFYSCAAIALLGAVISYVYIDDAPLSDDTSAAAGVDKGLPMRHAGSGSTHKGAMTSASTLSGPSSLKLPL